MVGNAVGIKLREKPGAPLGVSQGRRGLVRAGFECRAGLVRLLLPKAQFQQQLPPRGWDARTAGLDWLFH